MRHFIKRWSYSAILPIYLHCRILIIENKRLLQTFTTAVFELLLSMFINRDFAADADLPEASAVSAAAPGPHCFASSLEIGRNKLLKNNNTPKPKNSLI
nr:hypothetical protein [Flavobacterium sp. ASV13]